MTTVNDQRLVELAREGDLAAASELVTMFHQNIFAYLRRLCGDDHEAADLSQKTFSKAWQSLPSFRARSSFSTWLHGIAHHVYLDWRRARKISEVQPDSWWEARVADGPGPDEDVAERDMARLLYHCVDQLDEAKQQAVHLHYYQGLSLQETAEVLGIATSTVKYRLREALDSLRARIAKPNLQL